MELNEKKQVLEKFCQHFADKWKHVVDANTKGIEITKINELQETAIYSTVDILLELMDAHPNMKRALLAELFVIGTLVGSTNEETCNLTMEQAAVLDIIEELWTKYPTQRFTQLLFNLDVNRFANEADPAKENYLLRDPYNDTEQAILNRMIDSPLYKQYSEDIEKS